MNDAPATLDYANGRGPLRRRLIRQMFIVIGLKLLLVAVNVALAIAAVPPQVRLGGIALQLALTVLFLIILFRLARLR